MFLTHFHADFIAGHIELRDKAGATIHLGRRAEAEFECVLMKDGDMVEFGDVGRPDLLASIGVTADQLADMLYDTIFFCTVRSSTARSGRRSRMR